MFHFTLSSLVPHRNLVPICRLDIGKIAHNLPNSSVYVLKLILTITCFFNLRDLPMPMPGKIPDNCLQVYLMEANMSPNLSSAHFPPNRRVTNVQKPNRYLGMGGNIEAVFCLQVTVRAGHTLHAPAGWGHPGLRQVKVIQGSVR
jgi:hypothetical protein